MPFTTKKDHIVFACALGNTRSYEAMTKTPNAEILAGGYRGFFDINHTNNEWVRKYLQKFFLHAAFVIFQDEQEKMYQKQVDFLLSFLQELHIPFHILTTEQLANILLFEQEFEV